MNNQLNVCITVRDRLYITQKCIESIMLNSNKFNKINIYIFDNYSTINEERTNYFFSLLKNNMISYYSYDTAESTGDVFPKSSVFYRWITMMELNHNVLNLCTKTRLTKINDFYLLIDNDMILMPKWSEYMISSNYHLKKFEKNLHMLVPYPGGVPEIYRKDNCNYKFNSIFNKSDVIEINMGRGGGASGFWFCDYNQLLKLKWDFITMSKCYKKFKRHDTETWNMIKMKNGNINYVGCVKTEDPIALHMGGITGSVCNTLNDKTFNVKQKEIKESDEQFKNISLHDIMNKYKDRRSW
jgi:hypothetical protein